MSEPLAPFFLGAYGENDELLEKTLVELLRDHVYWRRNFHPEDLPPIGTELKYQPQFLEAVAKTRHELHQLTAKLKRSVPFFHPRYLGHMVSDLLLPGLIAQLVTTLYNPNNIVEDAAPVTVGLELEVGRQLCRMMGYALDEASTPCALGHLTGGGTIANDEALWLARAVKLWPLALKDAARAERFEMPELELDDRELLNLSPARVLSLVEQLRAGPDAAQRWRAVEAHRVEQVGLAAFGAAHPAVAHLVVLAPATAHYSWHKAMKLLGLGRRQLLEVSTSQGRLDPIALADTLERLGAEGRPVLAVVGVYGSTELGTLDPLHEVAALQGRPFHFWFHVDAAWGGYLPSVFRGPGGELHPREAVTRAFRHFPSERVYRSTEALRFADSITVDPHKLGFVPFGAGAFLAKDRRAFDLVSHDAAYVFTKHEGGSERYRHLGRYSLEGSRPGAAAAACYVNHRVLPLDSAHFGQLIARSVHAGEALFDRVPALAAALSEVAKVVVPFEPDCNVVCLAVNRVGNRSLRAANGLGRRLYEALAVRPDLPVQSRTFFGSCTTLSLTQLSPEERERIGAQLELDLSQPDDDGLFLLRHTVMNPWLLSPQGPDAPSFLDGYLSYVEQLIRELAV